MPRNQNAGNLALRNRNRVTNKTRLRVIKGNIDADPIVLDEDEERARVVSTAGVDAEDANEHHLQAVLSAASHRASTLGQKAARTSSTDKGSTQSEPTTAFIPVPDAAGLVDNYEELYPSGRWIQPATYVKSSDITDEYIRHALSDGFTYYMDERDAEWLDKNNKEARGEGTSAQGSVAISGTTTRASLRTSTKAKGKETEVFASTSMQEDEFELVMGIFEKLTHDNTPFLHVNLQRGTGVPPFSSYEEQFMTDLPASMFATFIRPADIPQPQILSRMARAVYPHWKTRRVEREGHRIIPTLNFDESDTKNESYICFRRREIKAVRKTRTAQVSSSEKLIRLKAELAFSLQLAQQVLIRESQKVEVKNEGQHVWEKRCAFVDLKRKYPALGIKEDEELLIDRPKKPRPNDMAAAQVLRIKNRSSLDNGSSPSPSDPYIRPRDRTITIQSAIEDHLKRQKERDHGWEDLIDNPYQTGPLSFSERSFKSFNSSTSGEQVNNHPARYLRLRFGRGGRMHLDRRIPITSTREILTKIRFPERLQGLSEGELAEKSWRLADRWKFDSDNQPASSESALDEEDRVILDDYDKKYLRHSIRLISEQDQIAINTDPKLHLNLPDGMQTVIPFRTSAATQSQTSARRDLHSAQRPPQVPPLFSQQVSQQQQQAISHQNPVTTSSSGTPVAMQAQAPIRKMPPPTSMPQMRNPSNGAIRAASHANGTQPNTAMPSKASSSSPVNIISNAVHGVGNGTSKPSFQTPSNSITLPNGGISNNNNTPLNGHELMTPARVSSPVRPQSQNQHHQNSQQIALPNGFSTAMANVQYNGFPNGIPNGYANHLSNQHNVLSMQQTQNLKVAFAALPGNQGVPLQPSLSNPNTIPSRPPSAYTQHLPNGTNNASINGLNMVPLNMTLKLPTNRQMQLAASNVNTRPQSVPVPNGIDLMHSPNFSHSSPNMMMRTPSANGHHMSPSQRSMSSPQGHYGAQGQGNGSSPNAHHIIPHSLSPHLGLQSQSQLTPPRPMQTPVPGPSPSMQHQQIVGGPLQQGNGY